MPIYTRPTSDQLRLNSQYTGEHILDTYLEAAEKGGRTLADLLDDLFNSAGDFYRSSGLYVWKGDYIVTQLYTQGDTFRDPATQSLYVVLRAYTSVSVAADLANGDIAIVVDGAYFEEKRQATADNAAAAQASATNAATSEANAATSEANAATSETNAATSAQTATDRAAAALTSENNAATSESNAATSEANAAQSKADAATSKANALTSENAAASSASDAATSEANALASENAAAQSETNAATSESNAATSEANAATSASAAASSAASSAAARDAALAALDSFDDRYLGVKSSDPTVDNDGNPLVSGALYYSSDLDAMKVYDGTNWFVAYAQTQDFLAKVNNLSDLPSKETARFNLELDQHYALLNGANDIDNLKSLRVADMPDGTTFDLTYTDYKKINNAPFPMQWRNTLAFGTDYTLTYETFDGTTWTESEPPMALFDEKSSTGINFTDNVNTPAWRITFNNQRYNDGLWMVTEFGYYQGVTTSVDFKMEWSDDNVTWTDEQNLTLTTGIRSNFTTIKDYNDKHYIRWTFTSSTGDPYRLINLRLLTQRVDGAGAPRERALPFLYDSDRNIIFEADTTTDGAATFDGSVFVNGQMAIAGDKSTVNGYLVGYDKGDKWARHAIVRQDGVMEVGAHIDFHLIDGSAVDNYARLQVLPDQPNELFINGNKIWHQNNDGAGSGLDADTVDGVTAAQFIRSDNFDLKFGYHDQTTRGDTGSSRALVKQTGVLHVNYDKDFGATYINGTTIRFITDNTTIVADDIWHSGNDGAGSGLNADLLDGVQGSKYARRDVANEFDGTISLDGELNFTNPTINIIDFEASDIRFRHYDGDSTYSERMKFNGAQGEIEFMNGDVRVHDQILVHLGDITGTAYDDWEKIAQFGGMEFFSHKWNGWEYDRFHKTSHAGETYFSVGSPSGEQLGFRMLLKGDALTDNAFARWNGTDWHDAIFDTDDANLGRVILSDLLTLASSGFESGNVSFYPSGDGNYLQTDGGLIPSSTDPDLNRDIGHASYPWRKVWAKDADFSGEVSANLLHHDGPVGSDILRSANRSMIRRTTTSGGMSIGYNDGLLLGAGEAIAAMDANLDPSAEFVHIGAEGGVRLYTFPNNDTTWGNRLEAVFGTDGVFNAPFFNGDGSALTNVDADTLDGLDASGFVQTNQTATVGNIELTNSGLGNARTINFQKNSDTAKIAVTEVANDQTEFAFLMTDNPSSNTDKFYWQIDSYKGDGHDWRPLQFSAYNASLLANQIDINGSMVVRDAPFYAYKDNINAFYKFSAAPDLTAFDASGFTENSYRQLALYVNADGDIEVYNGQGMNFIQDGTATPVATITPDGSSQLLAYGLYATFPTSGLTEGMAWQTTVYPAQGIKTATGDTYIHEGNVSLLGAIDAGTLGGFSQDQFLRSDATDTVNGKLQFVTSPEINTTTGLKFEGGNHAITYNDGGGNFNIRVGHTIDSNSDLVLTEDGYLSHMRWDQASGVWSFRSSTVSDTAGNIQPSTELMRISPTNVVLQSNGAERLATTASGVSMYGTSYLTADYPAYIMNEADTSTVGRIAMSAGQLRLEVQASGGATNDGDIILSGHGGNDLGSLQVQMDGQLNDILHTGSTIDADTLENFTYTKFAPVAKRWRYNGQNGTGFLKIRLPWDHTSAKMLSFDIVTYSSYAYKKFTVSGYLYPSTNNWYLPNVMYTGAGTPDIAFGRDTDGRAYVSIPHQSYTGVSIEQIVVGHTGTDADAYNDDWEIVDTTDRPNTTSGTFAKVWHSDNDGSGSGLDADMLDGLHSTDFATAAQGATADGALQRTGGTMSGQIDMGAFGLTVDNKKGFTTDGQYVRTQTPHGYIDFGPANSSFAHIYTDRPAFYFNQELRVNGAAVWHTNNDGDGSGLDADKLDGVHAAQFARTDTTETFASTVYVAGKFFPQGGISDGTDDVDEQRLVWGTSKVSAAVTYDPSTFVIALEDNLGISSITDVATGTVEWNYTDTMQTATYPYSLGLGIDPDADTAGNTGTESSGALYLRTTTSCRTNMSGASGGDTDRNASIIIEGLMA